MCCQLITKVSYGTAMLFNLKRFFYSLELNTSLYEKSYFSWRLNFSALYWCHCCKIELVWLPYSCWSCMEVQYHYVQFHCILTDKTASSRRLDRDESPSRSQILHRLICFTRHIKQNCCSSQESHLQIYACYIYFNFVSCLAGQCPF
jgi:hypothetical protein